MIKKTIKKKGFPDVDAYSLRHSGATTKLRLSGNIKALEKEGGWKSPDMLMKTYAISYDDDRKNIAELMEKHVYGNNNDNTNK